MASPRLRYGRYSRTGNVYSLTTVTLRREPFFADAANVAFLIDALRFVERAGLSYSLTWVVMPDHLHWLMELQQGTLAECMTLLRSRSSRMLNQRLGRRGAPWQHGCHDHALRSDESLHEKPCISWPIRSAQVWRARWGNTRTHGAVGRCNPLASGENHPRMAWMQHSPVICRNRCGRQAGA